MASTTVRISEETHIKLRQPAQETGQPMQAVLDAYRRERFFIALDDAYAALWADPTARAEELTERTLFEGTLADGLDEDQ